MARYVVDTDINVLTNNSVSLADAKVRLLRYFGGEHDVGTFDIVYTKNAVASAKRDPHDDEEPDIGALLAVGRALAIIGARMQKVAMKQVALADQRKGKALKKEGRRGAAKNSRR